MNILYKKKTNKTLKPAKSTLKEFCKENNIDYQKIRNKKFYVLPDEFTFSYLFFQDEYLNFLYSLLEEDSYLAQNIYRCFQNKDYYLNAKELFYLLKKVSIHLQSSDTKFQVAEWFFDNFSFCANLDVFHYTQKRTCFNCQKTSFLDYGYLEKQSNSVFKDKFYGACCIKEKEGQLALF